MASWASLFGAFGVQATAVEHAWGQCTQGWVSSPFQLGVDGPINAMINWDPDGPGPLGSKLVVAGAFANAGGQPADNIAVWDGTAWAALGGGANDFVASLAVLPNGELIAAGNFTSIGGVAASAIARWDGTAWHPLGTGLNGGAVALAVRPNGDLIAGGAFLNAGGVAAAHVALWNGTTWESMGSGVDAGVNALTVMPNGDVIAGGDFDNADALPAARIASWNGTTWAPLGLGMTNSVHALAVLPGGDLVAGGVFGSAGGVPAVRMARWNGTDWSAWPEGLTDRVVAIAVLPGGEIAVGGNFVGAGSVVANGVARWDGAHWGSLAEGTNGTVNSLLVTPDGSIVVGGNFSTAGTVSSPFLAKWGTGESASIGQQPAHVARCISESASFSVVASGTPPLSYQWRLNGAPIAGATLASHEIASVSPADLGGYDCVVTNPCGSVTSEVATLSLRTATSITTQPIGQSACTGAAVTLEVVGAGVSLTYQWRRNGIDLAGATASVLQFPSVGAPDAGSYDCVVAGACGPVTSDAATLNIAQAPSITTQPVGASVAAGLASQLVVDATGSPPITYQWKKGGVALSDGGAIAGSTTATLSFAFTATSDSGDYTCEVANQCGSVFSEVATLTVNGCPADLDNGTGTGVPDGGVDINDLLFFLAAFEAGGVGADLDDGTFTGTHDQAVTIDDLVYFLTHFEGGC